MRYFYDAETVELRRLKTIHASRHLPHRSCKKRAVPLVISVPPGPVVHILILLFVCVHI